MKSEHWDAIVIGAGIGGLSSAYALQQAGKKVLVLEAAGRPGGRIVRVSRNGDMAEGGAQGMHTNYQSMLRLVDQMGLRGDLRPSDGAAIFLDRQGRSRTVASDFDMLKLVGPRGAADLIRYKTQYFTFRTRIPQYEINRDVPHYDNVTAAEALSWAGPNFTDFVLRPQTHAQCGADPEHVNLYHLVNMLMLKLQTRAIGLKTGILTLLERLADKLDVRYNSKVDRILMSGGRVDGVQLEDGQTIKAGHVVVACPINAAARIVPEALGEARAYLSQVPVTPLPLVFFFLDRPLDIEPFAFIGHAWQPNAIFNMALNHARKLPDMVPSGKAIISAWPAYPGGADMIQRSDADIIARALADTEAMIPGLANMVEEARVQRHSWAFARHEPGAHRKLLTFKQYAATLRGISFVGNDYDGVHMESAARSGERAAARVLAGY